MAVRGAIRPGSAGPGLACGCSSSASPFCTADRITRRSRGKNERFHRTLKAEVFALKRLRDFAEVQRAFDAWRMVYNFERPHQALEHAVPASRYRPSLRSMPDRLPQVEYDQHELVRTVPTSKDYVSLKGRLWEVPQPLRGERVAIRPLTTDGCYGGF